MQYYICETCRRSKDVRAFSANAQECTEGSVGAHTWLRGRCKPSRHHAKNAAFVSARGDVGYL